MTPNVASELATLVPAVAAGWALDEEDPELPYVAMGHLAERLVLVADGPGEVDFGALFADLEARLAGGDPHVRNLLIVGLLEGLQNIEGDRSGRWEPLLGPSTRAAWNALNDMWAGRMKPADFNRLVDGPSDIR